MMSTRLLTLIILPTFYHHAVRAAFTVVHSTPTMATVPKDRYNGNVVALWRCHASPASSSYIRHSVTLHQQQQLQLWKTVRKPCDRRQWPNVRCQHRTQSLHHLMRTWVRLYSWRTHAVLRGTKHLKPRAAAGLRLLLLQPGAVQNVRSMGL